MPTRKLRNPFALLRKFSRCQQCCGGWLPQIVFIGANLVYAYSARTGDRLRCASLTFREHGRNVVMLPCKLLAAPKRTVCVGRHLR
jgi:hypothetical protein